MFVLSRFRVLALVVALTVGLVAGAVVPTPGWSAEDAPSDVEAGSTVTSSEEPVPAGESTDDAGQGGGSTAGVPETFVAGVDDVPQPGEEILGHTVYSRWWRKASGAIGRESFTRPHFFQDDQGVWRTIDSTLGATGDGWWMPLALPPSGARVAQSIDASSVTVELGDPLSRVRVRYPEVASTAGTLGDDGAVHFPGALGVADLVVGVSADGWKDSAVVSDASVSGYRVEFELPLGVLARNDGRGGVEFIDVTGKTVLVYGDGAVAWDTADPYPGEAPVAVTLVEQTGRRATVQVAVDQGWLSDPARVFPVVIDPIGKYDWTSGDNSQCTTSPNTFTACDTYVNSDLFDGAFWQQTQLRVGSYCCGYEQGTTLNRRARTFLLFPTDNYNSPPHTVDYATLTLWAEDDSGDGTADPYRLIGLGAYPTRNTTWANQPATSGPVIDTLNRAGSSKNYVWDASDLVNDWFRGTRTNYGIRIDAYPNEREITAGRKFSSSEHSTLPAPRLYAEYFNYPSDPGAPSVTAGSGSVTATWAASSDDGGGTITYEVQVRSGSTVVASTTKCETCTRSHTFTGLTNGQSYTVRVRATNETGSSAWKTSSTAVPDGTNPTTPSVSSSTHASQTAWSTSDDPCFSWSSSDPETGITGYSYVLDQSSSTTPNTTSNGTGTSTCYSGKADGEWWVHVRARNGRTNNNMWGSAAHYRVRIDDTAPPAPAVTSSTHSNPSLWYPNDEVTLAWPATDVSAITGYSYLLDQNPGTIPDTTSEGTEDNGTFTDLADGVWYFHVRAKNGSGLWSSTAHFTIQVDDTAPLMSWLSSSSHPSQDTWSTTNHATFEWDADDTSGIAGYSYSFDQIADTTPAETVTTTQNTVTMPDIADGEWWFHIRAVNGSGLWGDPLHYRIRIDGTAADLTSLSSSSHPDDTGWYPDPDVTYVWEASDHSGIVGYSIVLDQVAGTDPDEIVDTTATSRSYDDLADGTWWFHVRAKNGSGLWGDTSHVKVNIDGQAPTPPTITSSSHPDQNAWSPNDDPTWNWDASALSGIAGYSWVLDQNAATTPDNISEGSATTHSATDLPDGAWYLHVRAVSNTGVWGGTAHYRTRIDDTPPNAPAVSSSSHPNESTWYANSTASFQWTATDASGISGYSYVLDQQPTTTPDETVDTTATSRTFGSLTDGVWYLHLRARDGSGKWSTTSHRRIQIDASAPAPPDVVSPSHPDQSKWYSDDSPEWLWFATDISGIDGYSWVLDQAPDTVPDQAVDGYASETNAQGLQDGVWYFHLRARNGSGLWSETTHFRVQIDTTPPIDPIVNLIALGQDQFAGFWAAHDGQGQTSGMAGYAVVLEDAQTDPGTAVTTADNEQFWTVEEPGIYYLSVRAVDNAGNVSNVTVDAANSQDPLPANIPPAPACTAPATATTNVLRDPTSAEFGGQEHTVVAEVADSNARAFTVFDLDRDGVFDASDILAGELKATTANSLRELTVRPPADQWTCVGLIVGLPTVGAPYADVGGPVFAYHGPTTQLAAPAVDDPALAARADGKYLDDGLIVETNELADVPHVTAAITALPHVIAVRPVISQSSDNSELGRFLAVYLDSSKLVLDIAETISQLPGVHGVGRIPALVGHQASSPPAAEITQNVANIGRSRLFRTGKTVRVAVLDSGIYVGNPRNTHNALATTHIIGEWDCLHPNLIELLARSFAPYCDVTGTAPDAISHHGTSVAGVLLGRDDGVNPRYWGIAPDASIMSFRVTSGAEDKSGTCLQFAGCVNLSEAIVVAARQGAEVINMSIGPPNVDIQDFFTDIVGGVVYRRLIQRAATYTNRLGASIVVSAGNDGDADLDTFGTAAGVVSVGGVRSTQPTQRAAPSHYGETVDLAAAYNDYRIPYLPGGQGAYRQGSGTSYAAPTVSGLLAQLVGQGGVSHPLPLQAENWVRSASRHGTVLRGELGVGLIDIEASRLNDAVRVWGENRFRTGIAVTRHAFPGARAASDPNRPHSQMPELPSNVFVIPGSAADPNESWRYASAAMALAGANNDAVLAVRGADSPTDEGMNDAVEEIRRLLGCPADVEAVENRNVYVLGPVHPSLYNLLDDAGRCFQDHVHNLYPLSVNGTTASAEAAHNHSHNHSNKLIVASSEISADSISASAEAYARVTPIMLHPGTGALQQRFKVALDAARPWLQEILIAGGPATISDDVVGQIAARVPGVTITRVSGSNRYQTSVAWAQRMNSDDFSVATGDHWADSLLAGQLRRPIVLTQAKAIAPPSSVAAWINGRRTALVVGGPARVSEPLRKSIDDDINRGEPQ